MVHLPDAAPICTTGVPEGRYDWTNRSGFAGAVQRPEAKRQHCEAWRAGYWVLSNFVASS